MNGRQLLGLGIVAVAMGIVATRFLEAATDNAEKARVNACRALEPDPLPPQLRDQDAPDFELPDATGKKWSLRALRGKPVLLNFWFTTCPPCIEEVPSLEDLARRVGDAAVVLAVSVDEGGEGTDGAWAAIKKFFPRGTPLSVVLDSSKAVPKRYGTEKFPETYLIDAAGKVRHYFVNKKNWALAEAALCLDSLR